MRPCPPPEGPDRGVMEVEGLGADIWGNIDAQEYVGRQKGKEGAGRHAREL